MKRIALLPEGSVSHEAALQLLGDEPAELVYHKLISDVFLSTVHGKTDYSVIPIENTIEGSVSLHMDWLVNEVDLPIQVEWVYPSIQNLIGDRKEFVADSGEVDFTRIRQILSHPVATAQCQQFIRKHAPQAELVNAGSTTEAVGIVKEHPGQGLAAIGTNLGASIHKLDVLAQRVTDHDNNYTRFILIGNQPLAKLPQQIKQMKTSILVTLPEDFPGALHQVLAAFAWRRLNLSRIESRPTKKKLGSYYFYIDVLESVDSVLLTAAIEEIKALGCQVRVLGSYPSYTYQELISEVL
ncbi:MULTISPECIES: prephenate dehydratase [Paenibacillus]|jgi:prephenate dehydratase|uniref:Prephenate dehydratase n=1 Tax=Paenibacillus azoreducens TaxID=116718 RepID=A0A920CUL6_9BACL|nr:MULTISPECIES: prephenate dehydratase [Paenibacillus]MBE9917954.1 prephenate dehydratase [Paenibacillus donghaensis]GIO49558.1 prephenate dehydratase [Paenibacillus azoreducens]